MDGFDWFEYQVLAFEEILRKQDLNALQRQHAEQSLTQAKQDLEEARSRERCQCGQCNFRSDT